MFRDLIEKAEVLVEALPYIRRFHDKTLLIKFGGSVMTDPELARLFAVDILLLRYVGINVVIVHGGGKEISKWMKKLGKDAVFVDGLRVTDEETLEIGEMVLSGKINNQIVSLINRNGGPAVGLSGKDAGLFVARKIRSKGGKDLGFVGDVQSCDVSLIRTLCEKGYVPVVSSVGCDENGETLNLNADSVASELASSLGALKLIYLTDVMGLLVDGELLPRADLSGAKELLGSSQISGGMLPKLEFSIRALEAGVAAVHIINGRVEHAVLLELFTKVGIGSMLSARLETSVD